MVTLSLLSLCCRVLIIRVLRGAFNLQAAIQSCRVLSLAKSAQSSWTAINFYNLRASSHHPPPPWRMEAEEQIKGPSKDAFVQYKNIIIFCS